MSMMDFVHIVYGNEHFKRAAIAVLQQPADVHVLDRYVVFAVEMHEMFGLMATITPGKTLQEHRLDLWQPGCVNFIRMQPSLHSSDGEESYATWNGRMTLIKGDTDDVAELREGTSIRGFEESDVLRINTKCVHQEHTEGH